MDRYAPILILAFNRPDACAKVIDALRQVKPQAIFFAVDGPRPNRPNDHQACEKTCALTDRIDWPCKVKTFFRKDNRGCKHAPPEAITWFFDHVPAGIILEDDCVPTADFLLFATELLERYADDERIGMISGNNFYGFQSDRKASYHFSRHTHIWGWATWRRAWVHYDGELTAYRPHFEEIRHSISRNARFRRYWWRMVEGHQNGMDTWAIPWAVSLLANNRLSVAPRCNLVGNIGYREASTHTSFDYDQRYYIQTQPLAFPLIHPATVTLDTAADEQWENRYVSYWRRGMTVLGIRGGSIGRAIVRAADGVRSLLADANAGSPPPR